MATTATARPYTGADVPQGAPEVWIKAAVPGAGAAVVLHTDGSIDGTTNTDGVFLGKLKESAKWGYKPTLNEAYSAESPSSFRTLLEREEIYISGEWMELRSAVKLAHMMVGATSVTLTGPPASKLIQLGGIVIPPTFSAVLVYEQPDTPGKYDSIQLYKCMNMEGVEAPIQRNAPASSAFNFKAISVDSRAKGDRLAGLNFQS